MSEAPIFVFGSNLAGRHGRGAAQFALKHHGAVYGQGVGLQGNSWAIPTKNHQLRVLPLNEIGLYVAAFLAQAEALYPDREFEVTKIGCGLAGYTPEQIGPLFAMAPANVKLPVEFREAIARAGACNGSQTYRVADDGKSITFSPCGVTSWHPKDVENRFCARCHTFMSDLERRR